MYADPDPSSFLLELDNCPDDNWSAYAISPTGSSGESIPKNATAGGVMAKPSRVMAASMSPKSFKTMKRV
jgi:hypothetical protein